MMELRRIDVLNPLSHRWRDSIDFGVILESVPPPLLGALVRWAGDPGPMPTLNHDAAPLPAMDAGATAADHWHRKKSLSILQRTSKDGSETAGSHLLVGIWKSLTESLKWRLRRAERSVP